MKRCKLTGRFLPKQPRTIAAIAEELNRTIRRRRIVAQIDWVTERLSWGAIGVAFGAVGAILAGVL